MFTNVSLSLGELAAKATHVLLHRWLSNGAMRKVIGCWRHEADAAILSLYPYHRRPDDPVTQLIWMLEARIVRHHATNWISDSLPQAQALHSTEMPDRAPSLSLRVSQTMPHVGVGALYCKRGTARQTQRNKTNIWYCKIPHGLSLDTWNPETY